MKLRVVILVLAFALVGLGGLAAPVSAACGTCYWAADLVDHANQSATAGINHETGCEFPWGGSELAVSIYLGRALDAGTQSYELLLDGWNDCDCAAAQSGKAKLLDAISNAQSAVTLCDNIYCQDNEACPYASAALSRYNDAISTVDSCVSQACGASAS